MSMSENVRKRLTQFALDLERGNISSYRKTTVRRPATPKAGKRRKALKVNKK